MIKQFALLGAAGYIAERHMKAIKETGNNLVCTSDVFDVMGRIDSYFPDALFFGSEKDLFQYISSKNNSDKQISYASICTPNFLHYKHIKMAMQNQCNVICEKPMVVYPHEIDSIQSLEKETGKRVFTVLQLRHHPAILKLKNEIENGPDKIYDIDLTYVTTRGDWYLKSWKGNPEKSGGVATNIGIHFFDMITWIFGEVISNKVHVYNDSKAAGFLQLKKARVRWFLSIDYHDLPEVATSKNIRTYRSITVDNNEIEFSGGFTDLHTTTYQNILNGKGFGINDAEESIILSDQVRNTVPTGIKGDYHPFLKKTNH